MAPWIAAVAFLFAVTLGCGGSPVQPSPLPLGEPFELRAGARATLEGDVFVTFAEVASDSRCPMDALCVSAGQAIVNVMVAQRSNSTPQPALTLTRIGVSGSIFIDGVLVPVPWCTDGMRADCSLSTAEGKSTASTSAHRITLVQLAPYPRAATPIQPGDYVATFVIVPR